MHETGPTEAQGTGRVGDVIGALTAHIRGSELMPGDRLPSEAVLSKELKASRTVVREALRSLAAMRIVELNIGRRATVAQLDHGPLSLLIEHGVHTEQINVQQIYDVRRTIEARIVALAALRRTDAEGEEILEIARGMYAARQAPETLMELDLAFHAAIANASKNPVFELIVNAFHAIMRQTWPIGWRSRTTEEARQVMLDTHLGIARAIMAGDPVEASRLMGLHFDESVRALIDAGLA